MLPTSKRSAHLLMISAQRADDYVNKLLSSQVNSEEVLSIYPHYVCVLFGFESLKYMKAKYKLLQCQQGLKGETLTLDECLSLKSDYVEGTVLITLLLKT